VSNRAGEGERRLKTSGRQAIIRERITRGRAHGQDPLIRRFWEGGTLRTEGHANEQQGGWGTGGRRGGIRTISNNEAQSRPPNTQTKKDLTNLLLGLGGLNTGARRRLARLRGEEQGPCLVRQEIQSHLGK